MFPRSVQKIPILAGIYKTAIEKPGQTPPQNSEEFEQLFERMFSVTVKKDPDTTVMWFVLERSAKQTRNQLKLK